MALVVGIIGVVIAAAAAGYGAYSSSEAAAQQQRNAKAMAKRQSEADAAAGEARRKQVLYDAKRKQATMASREAAAGVQIGEGSLLESEMQFASDSEYAAQIAQLPYSQASDAAAFEGRIFGSTEKRIRSTEGLNTGIAAGSTLATGAASAYGKYNYYKSAPAVQPQENV
jgi:type II secretory pathway pseudopilin PulG